MPARTVWRRVLLALVAAALPPAGSCSLALSDMPAAQREDSGPRPGLTQGSGPAGNVSTGGEGFFYDDGKEGGEPQARRLMVYQAGLMLEVASVEESIVAAVAKAQALGGYLAKREDTRLVLRVPAATFEDMLVASRELGRVLSESIEASDVTREHQDLTMRLDNARKSRERLLALLARAEKVEDVLAIERELRRLTEEIERMEGELRYLDNRIALATVKLTFNPLGEHGSQPAARSRFWWINGVGAEQVRRDF